MKIKITTVYVNDQEKALRFYTEVLGFVKKADVSQGPYRWLTVASPEEPNGCELQLAPNSSPAARTYQQAMFEQGQPAAMFHTDDVQREYDRMQKLRAEFAMPPTKVTGSTIAQLNDNCGNLIQIVFPSCLVSRQVQAIPIRTLPPNFAPQLWMMDREAGRNSRGMRLASGRIVGVVGVSIGLLSGCLQVSSHGQVGGTTGRTGGSAGNPTNGGQPTGESIDPRCLALTVQPSVLDFGTALVNTTATKSVTLINKSTAEVDGIAATVSGPDANLFMVVDAPVTLAAGQSADVEISYSPLALETRSLASVTLSAGDCEKGTVKLSGEPVGVALTLAPNPIDLGYVRLLSTEVACTRVTNQTTVDMKITGVINFATEGGAFALATTDDATPPNPFALPLTIKGGQPEKVCFSFTPTIAEQYQGRVTLVTDDPSGTNPIVQLTGWGGGPQISCTPMTIDFGQTLDHTLSTVPIICTNTGTAIPGVNLVIDPPTTSPDVFTAGFDETSDPYPLGGLAPGQSVQIDVNYAPMAASTDKGTVFIKSNAGGGSTLEIPISGQGLNVPPCQFVVAPTALDFANVPLGDSSAPLSIEIQNVGSSICLVQRLSTPSDCAFHIVSTSIPPDPITGKITIPPPSLTGAASNLIVTIVFTPTAVGAASCEVGTIDGQPLELTGTSESQCLTVSPVSLDFGHVTLSDAGVIGTGVARTFEVSTQCQGKTSVESITLQSGPGEKIPQFTLPTGPLLPTTATQGSSLSFQLYCEPTTLGTHTAQLLISDGTVATLLPLACAVP